MKSKKYRVAPDKFRAARKEAGYSISGLAEAFHCSASLISKYEKGSALIEERNLSKLAMLLQVSPDSIVEKGPQDYPNWELHPDYLKWKFLCDSIALNFGLGTFLKFQDYVEHYCVPYWDRFSKKSEGLELPDNEVFRCTRRIGFKKKDLTNLSTINDALFIYRAQPETALSLSSAESHVFDFFMAQVPKLREIISALRAQKDIEEKGGGSYHVDIAVLDDLEAQLEYAEKEGKAISKAQEKRMTTGFFSADDFGGNEDIAAFWEDMLVCKDVRSIEDIQDEATVKK